MPFTVRRTGMVLVNFNKKYSDFWPIYHVSRKSNELNFVKLIKKSVAS